MPIKDFALPVILSLALTSGCQEKKDTLDIGVEAITTQINKILACVSENPNRELVMSTLSGEKIKFSGGITGELDYSGEVKKLFFVKDGVSFAYAGDFLIIEKGNSKILDISDNNFGFFDNSKSLEAANLQGEVGNYKSAVTDLYLSTLNEVDSFVCDTK